MTTAERNITPWTIVRGTATDFDLPTDASTTIRRITVRDTGRDIDGSSVPAIQRITVTGTHRDVATTTVHELTVTGEQFNTGGGKQ
jgi:hypothetical protein